MACRDGELDRVRSLVEVWEQSVDVDGCGGGWHGSGWRE